MREARHRRRPFVARVIPVHENVGARLDFVPGAQFHFEHEGAAARAGDARAGNAGALEHCPGLFYIEGDILDDRAPFLNRTNVLRASMVGVHARKFQAGRSGNRLRQRHRRLARRHPAAAHPHLELDVDIDARARAPHRRLELAHIGNVIHAHAELCAFRQRRQSLELLRPDDFVRHQHVRDAALDHRFGLRHLLAAHAHRAGGNLPLADFRALVGFRVRPHAHPPGDRVRQALDVGLERIQVEDQRRRVDLFQTHADGGGRAQRHARACLFLRKRNASARITTAINGDAA